MDWLIEDLENYGLEDVTFYEQDEEGLIFIAYQDDEEVVVQVDYMNNVVVENNKVEIELEGNVWTLRE